MKFRLLCSIVPALEYLLWISGPSILLLLELPAGRTALGGGVTQAPARQPAPNMSLVGRRFLGLVFSIFERSWSLQLAKWVAITLQAFGPYWPARVPSIEEVPSRWLSDAILVRLAPSSLLLAGAEGGAKLAKGGVVPPGGLLESLPLGSDQADPRDFPPWTLPPVPLG